MHEDWNATIRRSCFVVLCGRCRRGGAGPAAVALLRRRASFPMQVAPDPFAPHAYVCVGPHVSTRPQSMPGWTRCYGIRVGKTWTYINNLESVSARPGNSDQGNSDQILPDGVCTALICHAPGPWCLKQEDWASHALPACITT